MSGSTLGLRVGSRRGRTDIVRLYLIGRPKLRVSTFLPKLRARSGEFRRPLGDLLKSGDFELMGHFAVRAKLPDLIGRICLDSGPEDTGYSRRRIENASQAGQTAGGGRNLD